MVLYARIIDPDTYIASTHFIGNVTVEGSSCTADVLFGHIIKFLEEKHIAIAKLVGFGSHDRIKKWSGYKTQGRIASPKRHTLYGSSFQPVHVTSIQEHPLPQGHIKINKIKAEFITALQDQMKKRFPKESQKVASCFHILGLRTLSFLSPDEKEEYGRQKLNILADHFGSLKKSVKKTSAPMLHKEHLETQWSLCKEVVLREMYPRDEMSQLWQLVHQYHSSTFPNLMKLVSIALVMPYQTADGERFQPASRNRLEGNTLNRLMMINVEGPPIRELDFARALVVWKREKDRRLFHK